MTIAVHFSVCHFEKQATGILRILRNIFNTLLWSAIGIYMLLSIMLHIPAIQRFTGECVAKVLCEKFGTKVHVGNVNLGFLNRLIVDDLDMLDKSGKQMIRAARLSVNINLLELANGKIVVSSAQIFGLSANIYKANATAKLNCQFVIDSLSTEDDTKSTPLDLRINSFIVRRGAIRYDQLDMPYTNGKINPNHIDLKDISSHIILKHLTDNSINLNIKKLSVREASGMVLKNLSLLLKADKETVELRKLDLKLNSTEICSDSIKAEYGTKDGKIDWNSLMAKGNVKGKNVAAADFAFLVPKLKGISTNLNFDVEARCNNGRVNADRIALASANNDMKLLAVATVRFSGRKHDWNVRLKELSVSNEAMERTAKQLTQLKVVIPEQVMKLKSVAASGMAYGQGENVNARMNVRTALGDLSVKAEKTGNKIKAGITIPDFRIGEILGEEKLNRLSADITATGILGNGKLSRLDVKGNVNRIDYNGYSFKNIALNGRYAVNTAVAQIAVNDQNCSITVDGQVRNINTTPETSLTATIEELCTQRINLTRQWGDATFSARINANVTGKNFAGMRGEIEMSDFKMTTANRQYSLNSLAASIKPEQLGVVADFGHIIVNGKYNFATLAESMKSIVRRRLPTLPGIGNGKTTAGNNFKLQAELTDTEWLEALLGIPFHTEKPISIMAGVDDKDKSITANINMPEFSYDGSKYHSGKLTLTTGNDTLHANVKLRKMLEGDNDILLSLNADAADNKLNSDIYIDYNTPTRIKGTIKAETQFYKDFDGMNTMRVNIKPSQVAVKDTVWNVRPANITYNEKKIDVEHFAIEHDGQHIKIDGTATKSADDSICVDLHDVNVKYILDLVNFHSVEFSGQASGQAYLKSVLNNPDAYANITVGNFRFQKGRMGTLFANVMFDKNEKQINIDAHADEENGAQTIIKGYVSPAKNYINLGITAKNTNVEFLQSFCGSFMSDVNARANGFAQVVGDLDAVNLQGKLVADGNLKIKTLNTVYNLKNDTILMVPNEIIFAGDTVTDRNGNIAIVKGALHHKNLTRLTFDLDIMADHFLCYDFKDYNDNTFYGTVFGSGSCSIKGRPHEIDFNINMTPHRNSFIEYDASSPDAIADQNFIKWINHSDEDSTEVTHIAEDLEDDLNDASDIHINFNMNVTPDFTLRVLMDKATGDKISLNGNGALKASYFNKGSFDMFGTYLIDHGAYNLTIQNFIKKDFKFQQGSTIVFGGNPFNALLNLKAVYQVNGVPLADLKIGNSFSSNNVRVDCIMNIGGTPESIKVDFDFDMPTVNNDAKQMVRSLINSEEEMNQQVVYLLAIGRFMVDDKNNSTQEDAQQSQTSLAMQSLLSGTISQQMNNILGSVVKNRNWNFGTNISTGTEGFNNAEYEGLLSGSLFSNRLLINGQFGYRDNPNTTTSFIGDFDVKYLLTPNGNMAIKVYNQTNDRYFTKSSLNTQGLGLIFRRDFKNWKDLWNFRKKKKVKRAQ